MKLEKSFRNSHKKLATAYRCQAKKNFVQQLKDALSADVVGLRTSVGQSFAQYLRKNPDAKAKYDALKTPGETQRLKKEFRLNWAKDNLETITEVKHRQEESWSRVQGEHGVYMPFEKIVQEEGAETPPATVKAPSRGTGAAIWKPRVMEPRLPLKSRSQVRRMRKQLVRHQFCQCKSKQQRCTP